MTQRYQLYDIAESDWTTGIGLSSNLASAMKWDLCSANVLIGWLLLVLQVQPSLTFVSNTPCRTQRTVGRCDLSSTNLKDELPPSSQAVNDVKHRLVRLCQSSKKPDTYQIRDLISELEQTAEQAGIGQASAVSGLLAGEWQLLYAPEDDTRSSPFFWAFRKAFPDQSDQIFGITDAIPAPLKQIGPATQEIQWDEAIGNGSLVSRVQVATLGGMATSIMTTRASIVGVNGVDGIRLKVETTKPEDSTIVKTLFGPLAVTVNDRAPAFPSGEALERIAPGSSEVNMRTTFCDESLRVSRNDDRWDEAFVWRRKAFAMYDEL
jgi:hypothetical protein